jgi:hypothetical protein
MISYTINDEKYPLIKDPKRLLLNDLSITENIKFNKSWEIVSKIERYPEMPKSLFEQCIKYFTTINYKKLKCRKKHQHTIKCVETKRIPAYVLVPFINSLNLLKTCSDLGRVVVGIESNGEKLLVLRRKFKQHKFLKGNGGIIKVLKENNMDMLKGLFQYAIIIADEWLIERHDKILGMANQIHSVLMQGSYLTLFVPRVDVKVNGVKIPLAWHIDHEIKNKTKFSMADEKLILGKPEKPNYVYMLNYLKDGKRTVEPFLSSMGRFI